jgi:hypothetical protein
MLSKKPFVTYCKTLTLILFLFANSNNFSYALTTQHNKKIEPFKLPYNIGKINKEFNNKSKYKIYIIQDLHCHKNTQKNIYKIIYYLKNYYGEKLNNIYLEGSSGKIDTSILSNIKNKSFKNIFSNHLLENGYIDGAELYSIFNPNQISLYGIENENLYNKDLIFLYKSLYNKQTTCNSLNKIENCLNRIKNILYPKTLLEFEKQENNYINNKINLQIYIKYLIKKSKELNINLNEYENILISQKNNNFTDETILFQEINILNYKIKLKLTSNMQDVQDFIFCLNNINLLKKIINIQASKYEINQWNNNYSIFLEKINKLSILIHKEEIIKKHLEIIDQNLNNLKYFYNITEKRDDFMLRNMLNNLKKSNSKIAVMICGGFHTTNILEKLTAKGISYSLITPQISANKNYEKIYLKRIIELNQNIKTNSEINKILLQKYISLLKIRSCFVNGELQIPLKEFEKIIIDTNKELYSMNINSHTNNETKHGNKLFTIRDIEKIFLGLTLKGDQINISKTFNNLKTAKIYSPYTINSNTHLPTPYSPKNKTTFYIKLKKASSSDSSYPVIDKILINEKEYNPNDFVNPSNEQNNISLDTINLINLFYSVLTRRLIKLKREFVYEIIIDENMDSIPTISYVPLCDNFARITIPKNLLSTTNSTNSFLSQILLELEYQTYNIDQINTIINGMITNPVMQNFINVLLFIKENIQNCDEKRYNLYLKILSIITLLSYDIDFSELNNKKEKHQTKINLTAYELDITKLTENKILKNPMYTQILEFLEPYTGLMNPTVNSHQLEDIAQLINTQSNLESTLAPLIFTTNNNETNTAHEKEKTKHKKKSLTKKDTMPTASQTTVIYDYIKNHVCPILISTQSQIYANTLSGTNSGNRINNTSPQHSPNLSSSSSSSPTSSSENHYNDILSPSNSSASIPTSSSNHTRSRSSSTSPRKVTFSPDNVTKCYTESPQETAYKRKSLSLSDYLEREEREKIEHEKTKILQQPAQYQGKTKGQKIASLALNNTNNRDLQYIIKLIDKTLDHISENNIYLIIENSIEIIMHIKNLESKKEQLNSNISHFTNNFSLEMDDTTKNKFNEIIVNLINLYLQLGETTKAYIIALHTAKYFVMDKILKKLTEQEANPRVKETYIILASAKIISLPNTLQHWEKEITSRKSLFKVQKIWSKITTQISNLETFIPNNNINFDNWLTHELTFLKNNKHHYQQLTHIYSIIGSYDSFDKLKTSIEKNDIKNRNALENLYTEIFSNIPAYFLTFHTLIEILELFKIANKLSSNNFNSSSIIKQNYYSNKETDKHIFEAFQAELQTFKNNVLSKGEIIEYEKLTEIYDGLLIWSAFNKNNEQLDARILLTPSMQNIELKKYRTINIFIEKISSSISYLQKLSITHLVSDFSDKLKIEDLQTLKQIISAA